MCSCGPGVHAHASPSHPVSRHRAQRRRQRQPTADTRRRTGQHRYNGEHRELLQPHPIARWLCVGRADRRVHVPGARDGAARAADLARGAFCGDLHHQLDRYCHFPVADCPCGCTGAHPLPSNTCWNQCGRSRLHAAQQCVQACQ